LAEVVGILSSFRKDPFSLSIAWLHDCMEDCGITYNIINSNFGSVVADGVLALSDLEEGNRAQRKKASRDRLNASPSWIQDIKVCDLISNTSSIKIHDPKFAITYIEEKRLLLEVLDKANKDLLNIAWNMVND
jgi:(p)ppGpp synthase/HD superfamily hydrolase